MLDIIKEKMEQIPSVLQEKNIDLWLTFVRESDTLKDPALDLMIDRGVTWQSAFIFTKTGQKIIIVGSLDADNIKDSGLYSDIRTYVGGIGKSLRELLLELNPATIALNRSEDDVMCDGLSCGMFQTLLKILDGTDLVNRFVPSESIIAALRGRKTPSELARIQKAVDITEDLYEATTKFMKPGMTEKDVANFILGKIDGMGLGTAWDRKHCPGIFASVESAEAHAAPSDRTIEKGSVVHADFGVKYQGYCSDLQRTWYILKDGETQAPELVQRAFDALKKSIDNSFNAIKPGVEGRVIDKISRDTLIEEGFEEYAHALGHQVGRSTHDGAGILCPEWERYGTLPYLKIEKGQVYTLEPRINLKDYGTVTMEEMIYVTEDGAKYLSRQQTKLILI